jgi:cysteine-S-conjugate beta-lyase
MMKKHYNFDQVIDRRDSDSIKWNAYGPDVLPLWVADMDFVSPEPVIQALHQRVDHGIFGYPKGIGGTSKDTSEFQRTIVERMAGLYNWQIEPEDVLLVSGVVVGFNLACHTLLSPKQAVLIQTPVYPPILHAAQTTGVIQQEMELTHNPDGSYCVDWNAFEAAFTPQTGLFILCNPHNPVGKVFQREELEHMAEICLRHGVAICSDEIHCDLVFPGHHHFPIASLDKEIAQNSITLIAPSKTYNIAGLECSVAIIPNRELRKKYVKSTKGLTSWVNLMGQTAGLAAYQHGQEWLDQMLAYLLGNRNYLADYVQQHLPGFHMGVPEGTYLAWLDCRQADIPDNPYQFFLEKGRVALNDGETFGRGGAGFVRLNFGCPRSILEEALDRICSAYRDNTHSDLA